MGLSVLLLLLAGAGENFSRNYCCRSKQALAQGVLTLCDGERQVPALHLFECQAAKPQPWPLSTWYQPI